MSRPFQAVPLAFAAATTVSLAAAAHAVPIYVENFDHAGADAAVGWLDDGSTARLEGFAQSPLSDPAGVNNNSVAGATAEEGYFNSSGNRSYVTTTEYNFEFDTLGGWSFDGRSKRNSQRDVSLVVFIDDVRYTGPTLGLIGDGGATWQNYSDTLEATDMWSYDDAGTPATLTTADLSGTVTQFGFEFINTGDGNLYIDNFTLEAVPVPEPASLAVLGMGGLGLLARRRRPA